MPKSQPDRSEVEKSPNDQLLIPRAAWDAVCERAEKAEQALAVAPDRIKWLEDKLKKLST